MLHVFASFAEDILLNEERQELKRQMGGPAFFIQNALGKMGSKFELTSSTPAQVELVMTNAGETHTKLVAKAAAFTPRFADLSGKGVLISTTINEINLQGIEKFPGPAFIDVQGYVRYPEDSSQKRLWEEGSQLEAFCLKATQAELAFLPPQLIERQKHKILIVTKGSEGLDLYIQNKRHGIPVPNKIAGRDTIGAGDTLLANFAARYLQTGNPLQSAEYAMNAVVEFLSEKPKLENLGLGKY